MMRIDVLSLLVLGAMGLALQSREASAFTSGPGAGTGNPNHSPDAPVHLSAANWSSVRAAQTAYLKASNTGGGDQFGHSVAMSGDTLVVGARLEESNASGVNGDQSNNSAPAAGAAYVFVRSGTSWVQQAYLKASNTETNDGFGYSVAISGDTVVIGAPFEGSGATGVNGEQSNNNAPFSGAAYVFVRNGTSWSQAAYLKSSNSEGGDNFGWTVSVSNDTVVVGAILERSNATGVNGNQNDNSATFAGAAYVFVRAGASWVQEAYLKASNTETGDSFSSSVSISGDTLVVGADGERSNAIGVNGNQNDNSAPFAGAAYVFMRDGTSWSQQAYLKASNTGSTDHFGWSSAISDDTIVVGALGEDSSATGVNGDQNDNGCRESGAAYVFVRNGTTWSQEAYMKASNTGGCNFPGEGDFFGQSVALSEDSLVVGAHSEASNATGVNGNQSNNSARFSGAAYVFARCGAQWSQQAYLKASNTEESDMFGWSVALSAEDAVIVAAPFEDSMATGVNGDQSDNGAFLAGAAYAFDLGPQSDVAFRNAGSNPASYTADPIVIGAAFTATVDNNLASQLASLLFAFESAASIPLGGGQTLLCLDLGSGELFKCGNGSLAPTSSAGGVDSYSLAVPNNPALCGFAFASQAIEFGHFPFVLSNAQDFTIGGP